jgi:hypothetical protein
MNGVSSILMRSFSDCVGLRILNHYWTVFDSINSKNSLKISTDEFTIIVLDATFQLRVMSQPMVLKEHANILLAEPEGDAAF